MSERDEELEICPICGKRIDFSKTYYTIDVEKCYRSTGALEQVCLCERCGRDEAHRLGMVML